MRNSPGRSAKSWKKSRSVSRAIPYIVTLKWRGERVGMKSPKGVSKRGKEVRPRVPSPNYIVFPQELHDAIPGPELPGCARSLILSSIDGNCGSDYLFGKRVRLKFLAQESGKLK